jgi:sterol desaturase/sphingolipid hydroxylase (fatty acid hydroxylase superfamily)
MSVWIADHAVLLRLALVLLVLSLLLALERLRPRREVTPDWKRRGRNLALAPLGALLLYLVMPVTAVAFAQQAATGSFGALTRVDWPHWLEMALGLVLLDLAIYGQHRAFHRIALLWPLHRVHHSDIAFDVSTGLRFHPGEILLSMGYKLGVIALLAPSAITVACYEMLLVGFALITHANVSLPTGVDRLLRRVFVTPDWHRVHHSVHRDETDSNYGNILSLWDRIFASYRAQPRAGHVAMQIGLPQLRDAEFQSLSALLLQPARRVLPTSGTE